LIVQVRRSEAMNVLDHDKLDVYQAAIEFVALADDIVEHLPRADEAGSTDKRIGLGLGARNERIPRPVYHIWPDDDRCASASGLGHFACERRAHQMGVRCDEGVNPTCRAMSCGRRTENGSRGRRGSIDDTTASRSMAIALHLTRRDIGNSDAERTPDSQFGPGRSARSARRPIS